MSSQLKRALDSLLHTLVAVRCAGSDCPDVHYWGVYGTGQGQIRALNDVGLITWEQYVSLTDVLMSASDHSGKPFPSGKNAGPVMPPYIAVERRQSAVKPLAQVPADEHVIEIPAPVARPELQLLCLLVRSRSGETRSLPVHTLRPMPPRVCAADSHNKDGQDRWCLDSPRIGMGGDTGLYLRETHATRPSTEVLERCARHGQTHALRADLRTVRAGGLNHG